MNESESEAVTEHQGPGRDRRGFSAGDGAVAAAWFALAILARLPFVLRAEGVLDHDQSVVGLMALDIAAGRRFPIFFDGQRYMSAVEGYVAAAFTLLLGTRGARRASSPVRAFCLLRDSSRRWRRCSGALLPW